MSVSTLNDPLGVGFNQFNSTGGRADDVSGVNPYQDQSLNQWINPAAFVNPPNNLDRTHAGQFGAQVGNLFNHANYAPPFQLTPGGSRICFELRRCKQRRGPARGRPS
jgi:hypothetical protein